MVISELHVCAVSGPLPQGRTRPAKATCRPLIRGRQARDMAVRFAELAVLSHCRDNLRSLRTVPVASQALYLCGETNQEIAMFRVEALRDSARTAEAA